MTNAETVPAILGGQPVRPSGPPGWPGENAEVAAVLRNAASDNSWGKYHGPHCETLKGRIQKLLACEHVHLCSSGTAAVELALRGVKVGMRDEVLLAAYDFKGNFQDVLSVGATPALVDIRADDAALDVSLLSGAISSATKAVIVSHLHGGIVNMPAVMKLAGECGFAVIEDACQVPGAIVYGRPAGTWGDVGVFSFGGSKLLTAGRGGAVFSDRQDVMQRIRLHTHRGNEAYPLSELQAALLVPQCDQLQNRNLRRGRNVRRLKELFAQEAGIRFLETQDAASESAYYKLGMWYDSAAFDGLSRDVFAQAMRHEGIALDPGFRSLHLIHSRRRFREATRLAVADSADTSLLTLHHPVLLGDETALIEIHSALRKIRAHATALRESKSIPRDE